MEKLSGESLNIRKESVEKLKQLFPEIKTDGKIDFEKLKQILGNELETDKERYNFTWNGKQEALRNSQTPSTGTLRPCKEESKNFDETQNLYIEGDNLEVLKLLQKSYFEKVKMIYIDPPYNTGKDFVYKDNFKDNLKNYKEITGQVDSEGNNYSTNAESNGRYHSDWLNMMYPRLRLARNLLKEDGIIFISIDDHEQSNLKKICDEIFGEDNFIADFIWRKKAGGSNDSIDVAVEHEYVFAYKKDVNGIYKLPLKAETLKDYKLEDEKIEVSGRYKLKDLNDKSLQDSIGLHFDVECPDGTVLNGNQHQWKCNFDTFKKRLDDNRIVIKKNSLDKWKVYYKIYLNEEKGLLRYDEKGQVIQKGRNPESILYSIGLNKIGSDELKKIFKGDKPFDYPKPTTLIKNFILMSTKKGDLILDFFSGSATTAHAAMELNAEDGGNRKYICVQLPEETDEKSEAYKEGYKNICEIGKERIRRAGKQILEELKENKDLFSENGSKLDVGFKVLKLDSSNIKKWNSENKIDELDLFKYVDNIEDGRTQEDILYEIILKMGLELTYPIEEIKVSGKTIYTIGFGALMICIDDNVTIEVAERMVKEYKEQNPETWKVVFMDNSFKDDAEKINIIETLKCAGLDEDNFVTI